MKGTPFQGVRDAAKTTGVSEFFIRAGLRAGTIPSIRSGNKYLIDVEGLVLQLQQQARAGSVVPLPEWDAEGRVDA